MSVSFVRNTQIPNFTLESGFTTGLNSCDNMFFLVYTLFNM